MIALPMATQVVGGACLAVILRSCSCAEPLPVQHFSMNTKSLIGRRNEKTA
jgi:hypothetical protein